MEKDLAKIRKTAHEEISQAQTLDALENARISYLGRKEGALTAVLRALKNMPEEERKQVGTQANALRSEIEELIESRKQELEKTASESILKKEWIDVTRPGIRPAKGHLHPLTKITREIVGIFSSMGFEVVEGPDVETEYYNFDALNIPADHPARDMWDTFWLKEPKSEVKSNRLLLRTHTSPVQVRYMEMHNPPIRIIVPGRVYRYEATDASHDIQFNQVEGLFVDKDVSIANFKATIQDFFARLFRSVIKIRLRPSYFPFTEPSFEVDITCVACDRGFTRNDTRKNAGKNRCSVCKGTSWVELAGAGMVHPHVFKAAGYNPKEVTGFAFGMGIDRLAMIKYKIPDIRLFHSGDLRFLRQF